MADFKFGSAMPADGQFQDFYDDGSLQLKSNTETEAIFEDMDGNSIVLIGVNLDERNVEIVGGIVDSVTFENSLGETLISVTNGNYNAKKIAALLEHDASVFDFMSALSAGDDSIFGSNTIASNLNIGLNDGDDIINFGKAGGFAEGSKGDDTYWGNDGFCTLSYENAISINSKGIVANLITGDITDCWGGADTAYGMDELHGTAYSDKMIGNGQSFMGLRGNDRFFGAKSEETLLYDHDVDYGGNRGINAHLEKNFVVDGFGNRDRVRNIESVIGTIFNDIFVGNKHTNTFAGLVGKDKYDGGGDTDTIDFFSSRDVGQHGVKVDLSRSKNQIADDGFGNVETAINVEGLYGSAFSDTFKLADTYGWADGDSGDDRLIAGKGLQYFSGGSGADTFVFGSAKILTNRNSFHNISDFSHGDGDKIDFSGIAGMHFSGAGSLVGDAGEVRYRNDGDSTFVYGDIDGDSVKDFELELDGKMELVAADFSM